MKYRIEYAKGACDFANGSRELIKKLMQTDRQVTDVRKLYKSGASDSVMELYRRYLSDGKDEKSWI